MEKVFPYFYVSVGKVLLLMYLVMEWKLAQFAFIPNYFTTDKKLVIPLTISPLSISTFICIRKNTSFLFLILSLHTSIDFKFLNE